MTALQSALWATQSGWVRRLLCYTAACLMGFSHGGPVTGAPPPCAGCGSYAGDLF